MSKNSPNSPKVNWILILTIIGTVIAGGGVIATLVTVPEFRCFLLGWSCSPSSKDVELVTRTQSGEILPGVEITVIGSGGPPEKTQTDSNGYAKITIANKGDVSVSLSKSGYPTQEFTINLQNEQSLVRIIRFSSSGKPEVIASAILPSPPPSATKPYTPLARTVTAVENNFMSMNLSGVSKSQDGEIRLAFIITNKTTDNLYLGLSNEYGTITDNFGQICGNRQLEGLATISSSANQPSNFTLISPNSTSTVAASQCRFPTSTEFNATFPLVRYQPSTTNPAGEQTKFSVGFTGIKETSLAPKSQQPNN
jgi:hypothetical protein